MRRDDGEELERDKDCIRDKNKGVKNLNLNKQIFLPKYIINFDCNFAFFMSKSYARLLYIFTFLFRLLSFFCSHLPFAPVYSCVDAIFLWISHSPSLFYFSQSQWVIYEKAEISHPKFMTVLAVGVFEIRPLFFFSLMLHFIQALRKFFITWKMIDKRHLTKEINQVKFHTEFWEMFTFVSHIYRKNKTNSERAREEFSQQKNIDCELYEMS